MLCDLEYGYGGHPFDFSGVFSIDPRDEETLGKDTFKFKWIFTPFQQGANYIIYIEHFYYYSF